MTTQLDVNRLYPVNDAIPFMGFKSRAYFYRKVRQGEIKTCKDGRRRLVHGAEIQRYNAAMAAGAQS
jgi:excisionase family DNA binding protein